MALFKNSFDRAWEKANKEDSDLSKKSLDDLCNFIGLQKEGSPLHLLGMFELQKRQNHNTVLVSRIALIISVITALILLFNTILSYFCK